MWLYIIQGRGYGFAAAVQPGPFQTYLISQKQGLETSFPHGTRSSDKRWADHRTLPSCAHSGSSVASTLSLYRWGSFILYLAYGPYRTWKNFDSNISSTESGTHQGTLKAARVNMLNPNPFDDLVRDSRQWHGIYRWFLLSLIFSLSAIVVVFGTARQFGPKVNRALLGISAIALFCFGLYQLSRGMMDT